MNEDDIIADESFWNTDIGRSLEALREARKGRFVVTEGTVIRFKSSIYTYAAVFAGSRWWITGSGRFYGRNVFTNKEFLDEVLAEASEVLMASQWENI